MTLVRTLKTQAKKLLRHRSYPLSRDHVVWAYRLLLDRDPENDAVIEEKLKAFSSTSDLRVGFLHSDEFKEKNPDTAYSSEENFVYKELRPGLKLKCNLSDFGVSLPIIRGNYEPAAQNFFEKQAKPGHNVIDIGANIGLFTLLAADLVGNKGSVTSFEPCTPNFAMLEDSINENQLNDRVTILKQAVGAKAANCLITRPKNMTNSGGAYVETKAGGSTIDSISESVPMIRLDELESLPRPIHLIKMDIEGSEYLALQGMLKILQEDRPVLLTEIHREQLQAVSHVSAKKFIQAIKQLGYAPYDLDNDGACVPFHEDNRLVFTNVVFRPKE